MKTMRKMFAAACTAAFVLASCQEESFEGRPDQDNYYASVETFGTDTRTALGEGRSVVWSSEDRIAIFEGNGAGQAYQVLNAYVGKSSGEFEEVEGLVAEGTGAAIEGTIAVYPFNEDLTVTSGDNGDYIIEGISFPAEQKYIAGSFSDEAFPMTAICEQGSKNLSFKNIGGVLKLSLTGSYSVSQITLTSNSGEPLSGPAKVTLGPDGIPSVTMSDEASTSVSLVCDPAVQLDTDTATDFYISIPPTEFEAGFKVTILDGEGKEHGLATHKTNSVERSSILAMPESTPESLDGIELTADTFCSVDFIEGWTETRFGGDGTIVFVKEDEQGRMTHSLMFLPDEENILMPVYIRYDENEIPSYMSFMDTEIYIDGYTDSTVDFTLAVEDAVWSIKDVPCNELMPYSLQTRAWSDNNAIRNACAIGELIVGVAGVAGGVVMISASGIGEVMTAGASTPVSVAGIALGVANIIGGCESIIGSLETIFGPAEQTQSTYVKDGLMGIGMEKLSDAIQDAPKNEFIKEILPAAILKDPADLGKLGTISYWSGFIFSSIDEVWGKTYTGLADLAQIHQDVNVVTGRADNITEDSAELYGYVSPVATAPFGDRIITEIYIVVWKAGDENNKQNRSIFNSDGGTVSLKFIDLEPDTEYCYQTIFEDLDNKIYRFGEVKTFKTKGEPVCITGEASDISTTSAVVNCTYFNTPKDAQCQVELYIYYPFDSICINAENKEGEQAISLSGLSPNTTYTYRAVINTENGPIYGEIKEFKTKKIQAEQVDITYEAVPDEDPYYINFNCKMFLKINRDDLGDGKYIVDYIEGDSMIARNINTSIDNSGIAQFEFTIHVNISDLNCNKNNLSLEYNTLLEAIINEDNRYYSTCSLGKHKLVYYGNPRVELKCDYSNVHQISEKTSKGTKYIKSYDLIVYDPWCVDIAFRCYDAWLRRTLRNGETYSEEPPISRQPTKVNCPKHTAILDSFEASCLEAYIFKDHTCITCEKGLYCASLGEMPYHETQGASQWNELELLNGNLIKSQVIKDTWNCYYFVYNSYSDAIDACAASEYPPVPEGPTP